MWNAIYLLPLMLGQFADHPLLGRPLDVRRVAVQIAPEGNENAIKTWLGAISLSDLGLPGWRIADLPPKLQSKSSIFELEYRAETAPVGLRLLSRVYQGEDNGPVIPTTDLLIRIQGGLNPQQWVASLQLETAIKSLELNWGGMPQVLKIGLETRHSGEIIAALQRVLKAPGVIWAEPDCIFTGHGGVDTPNDPLFGLCWGIHNVGQDGGLVDFDMDGVEAWDITPGSPSVVVGVLDTGVQPDHPDLSIAPGVDVTSDGPVGAGAPVNNCDIHGTPVAGCIVGAVNNATGGCGIAPGCKVASIRTFVSTAACNSSWVGQASWTVAGLDWALNNGVRITCNSNTYGFKSSSIDDKYLQTYNAGVLHFACAGNTGATGLVYPGSIPIVDSVTWTKKSGSLSANATTGTGLDFAAPGSEILTTDRTGPLGFVSGDFVLISGCSFATPYAAGIAALILSVDPTFSPQEIEGVMQTSSTDLGPLGYDTSFGFGMVNALNAVAGAVMSGDVNADGSVNGADLGLLLAAWETSNAAADVNGDGVVDGADLGLLLSNWSG